MKKLISFVTVGLLAFGLFAQESVKSLEEEYYDYLSLVGEVERPYLGYRSFSDSVWNVKEDAVHPWMNNNLGTTFKYVDLSNYKDNFYLRGVNPYISLKFYGPEWYNSYNTKNPYGYNDGGLWQGAGYNTALTGGVHFEAFGFEASFKPQLSFSQNKAYEYLKGRGNPFNYYCYPDDLHNEKIYIDLVQRYGDKAFFNYDWGDSEVRYSFYNWTIGFGTSNSWIGPAYLNPVLGSNNAGGYPKVDFGLKKTRIILPWNDFYIGDLEFRLLSGMLYESAYFDDDFSNDKRMLNGLFVSYSPFFIPGLTIGANRVFVTNWDIKNLKYLGKLFVVTHNTNDVHGAGEDQKVSLYFDWLFPSVGFEMYGEYGFDDFSSDPIANLFHTGIFTLGFKKDIPLWESAREQNVRSELIFEYNNFEMSQDFQLQWDYGGYYTHNLIKQGYTNNGQILGAGTGYAGNSQYLAYSVYYPKGKTTVFVQRSCPDNNYIYNMAVPYAAEEVNEKYYSSNITYIDLGIKTSFFIDKSFILTAGTTYNYIHNWMYESGKNIKDNFQFNCGVKVNF